MSHWVWCMTYKTFFIWIIINLYICIICRLNVTVDDNMVSWSWPTFHQTQLGTAWVFSGPLYQAILIGKVEPCFPVHDTDRAVILNRSSLRCSVCLLLHLFRNLQAAICSYYDIEQPAVELPSMTVVDDVTIGEGESVPPKTRFFKAWRIQNSGKPFLQLGHNIMYSDIEWLTSFLFSKL